MVAECEYDVFISYRHDKGTHQALALRADLEHKEHEGHKLCSVFMDTRKMGSGDFTKKLDKKIREYSNFVVIISKDCFPHQGKGKDFFLYEIGLALRLGKNVIPIYYDGMEYKNIEEYLYGIENFQNQNAIIYHNDDPEGSVNQIISFLKTKEEVLKERFESLSKETKEIHSEFNKLLEGDNSDLNCPVCGHSNDIASTFCRTCGYKFFDKLEESVAEQNEKVLESDRVKIHKDLWNKCQNNTISKNESPQTPNGEPNKSQLNESRDNNGFLSIEQDKSTSWKNKWVYYVIGLIIIVLMSVLFVLIKRSFIPNTNKHVEEEALVVDSVLTISVDSVEFKMIMVEGGTFMMGAQSVPGINFDSKAKPNESPVHNVTLDSYYIGETEVTQALWMAVMEKEPTNKNGGWSSGRGYDYPAYRVSWNDVRDFIHKLNQKTNKEFRLPTEEEWEYAARGGHKRKGYKYAGNDSIDAVAWYWRNSGINRLSGDYNTDTINKNNCKTHSVKGLRPNELGLYDMSGNVGEWCQNGLYDTVSVSSSVTMRVLRGGSWFDEARTCRVSNRWYQPDTIKYTSVGFRLVLSQ